MDRDFAFVVDAKVEVLTEAEIEAVSAKTIENVTKATGGTLRA